MTTFLPAEKGMTIRMPSTANLMIDSNDRDVARFPSPWDFQIIRPQSLLNGFFTRIATAEVVLEWNTPNGLYLSELPSISITWATGPATKNVNVFLQTGFYTAADALDALAEACNTAFGTTVFEVVGTNGIVALQTSDNSDFSMVPNATTRTLGFNDVDAALSISAHQIYNNPDLRPFRYIDFVSAQLTYNQDLKDTATNKNNRDVLCRWYFSWDQPPQVDTYGFPILMGYTPFYARRLFNPPKQIRWDNIQPLGNLSFQVYDENGVLLINNTDIQASNLSANWLMTLQISEC